MVFLDHPFAQAVKFSSI